MPSKIAGRGAAATGKTARSLKGRHSAPARGPVDHIMPAPKGQRTLTHREIKEAVRHVFERRSTADA